MSQDAADRLRTALEMFELGEGMFRARMMREHPTASTAELDLMVREWLHNRPGAPHGDAVGRPSSRFE